MNKDVTEKLGGYQQIVDGIVKHGDMVTFHVEGERVLLPVDIEIGLTVQETESLFEAKVYRKIPVAHQGDIDHPPLRANYMQVLGEMPAPQSGVFSSPSFISQDSAERKQAPMHRGLLGYFPAALFEIARHSMEGEKKHNPGATDGPTWSRGKSTDHADCIVRHLIDAGDLNTPDRLEHLRALAWRSCALLQEECERRGAKPGISSRHG